MDAILKDRYIQQHRIQYTRKSKIQTRRNRIDLYESALYRLYYDGFDIREQGTIYIAKLICRLYHERYLLEKYYDRPSYSNYWDLSDRNNIHYQLLGNDKDSIERIREAIIHSQCEDDDADINELIYDLCDLEIRRNNEDDKSYDEQISYKKLLLHQ